MVLNRRFFCALALILSLLAPSAKAAAPSADGVRADIATGDAGAAKVDVADYIRLHVVAEDDGESAQALKLEVRDACLEAARALLADCADADAAWRAVNDGLDALASAAESRARERGYAGAVTAQAGTFDFPDRWYGDTFVPAGRYRALRVVIGAGRGHNWWCVLFPSLCMPGAADTDEPPRFHSSILRWLRGLFGGAA